MRCSLRFLLGVHVEPALQFLNVEIRFLMLAETCTLEISFLFRLESLCRKLDLRVLVFSGWALNHMISAVPNRHAGFFLARVLVWWCAWFLLGGIGLVLRGSWSVRLRCQASIRGQVVLVLRSVVWGRR